MKTGEQPITTVSSQQESIQPFFTKKADDNFFAETGNTTTPFFKPSPVYNVNKSAPLQAKLTVGKPNDEYEQEADSIADKVVQRMASPGPMKEKEDGIQTKPLASGISPLVQKKCTECEKEEEDLVQESPTEVQRKPIFESNAEPPDDESNVQRKCAECEKEKVQAKLHSDKATPASPLENQLNTSKGTGSPLPSPTKTEMESSFGTDFSGVRIHDNSTAAQMNQGLNARAFTHGKDIYFNSGELKDNNDGKKLLAHELTHVVQQGQATSNTVQRLDVPTLFKSNRELIDEALSSKSAVVVQSISDFSVATVDERIKLIGIVLDQGWVGPLDESAIENIWESFGDSLPEVAIANFPLWTSCVERGAELDDLDKVESIKEQFKKDVNEIAVNFLLLNRNFVLEEMGRLGIAEAVGTPTADQAAYLKEIEDAAKQVKRAQDAQQALRQIEVGYDDVYSHVEDMTPSEVPVNFSPDHKPMYGPRTGDNMANWEEVKEHYDKVSAVIAGLGNRYPAVYALIRDEKIGDISADNVPPEKALSLVRTSFLRVLQDIDETVPKIDSGDIEYYDFVPIHQQLFDGSVTATSGIPWNTDFYKWIAQDDLSDHESRQFWIQLGLATLAAAAFVVAELATAGSATFFIAAGVGVGVSAGQAAFSWEHYLDLAQTAKTNVTDDTALISTGQVSAALVDAVLNTAFALVDVYAPVAKIARAGTGSASKALTIAARREILDASKKEAAELTAKEAAQKKAAIEIGDEISKDIGEKTGQALGKEALQSIRQFVSELIESCKNWAKRVFESFGFKSFQVVDEGEWMAMYGIRSRVLLARFKKSTVKTLINNDPQITASRHSRSSQLGKAAAAKARGDDALANLLRQNAIELSEEIGEEAAQIAIKKQFPTAVLVHQGHGSGTLDLIYKLPSGDFIVVEAKGGRGRLITRQAGAAVEAEQGTVTYLRSVLDEMISRGELIANDVLLALGPPRKLKYFLSKTPIPSGSTKLETTLKEFVI